MGMTTDEFLAHYGVQGMKWGVRRNRAVVKPSSDKKKAEELRKKGTTALTNKQLKTVNERANLEQNFNRMNPTTRQKGEAQVKAALATFALGLSIFGLTHKEFLTKASEKGKDFIKRRAAKKMITTIVTPPSEMFIG